MCVPRTLVEALMALSGSGLLLYALYGLAVGTIYDTEEPTRIVYADQPVAFVLYILAVIMLALVLIDLGFSLGFSHHVSRLLPRS